MACVMCIRVIWTLRKYSLSIKILVLAYKSTTQRQKQANEIAVPFYYLNSCSNSRLVRRVVNAGQNVCAQQMVIFGCPGIEASFFFLFSLNLSHHLLLLCVILKLSSVVTANSSKYTCILFTRSTHFCCMLYTLYRLFDREMTSYCGNLVSFNSVKKNVALSSHETFRNSSPCKCPAVYSSRMHESTS